MHRSYALGVSPALLAAAFAMLYQSEARADGPGLRLRVELANAEAEDAELAVSYGTNWPRRDELRSMIGPLRQAVEAAEPLTETDSNELQKLLAEHIAQQRVRLAGLLERFGSQWPEVCAVQARLEVLERYQMQQS